jgi:cobalamin biosynthetic protein CobC
MIGHVDAAEPLAHGGDLGEARRLFPGAPEPFIDLSTGINPYPYPVPPLPPDAFARLPDAAATHRLAEVAARAYGAPSEAHVVPAPGTQILLPQVMALVPPGRAAILGVTYGEFRRVAALAGHAVIEAQTVEQLREANLAIVVNPNNPDGRVIGRDVLLDLADALRASGGLLVVDEAFMDVGPAGASLAGDVGRGNIVVLRSFGKFFGLAGLRLGFALAAPQLAHRLAAVLGPWAVSGPALAIGAVALADTAWAEKARMRLGTAAAELDSLLAGAGLDLIGGTSLFRLVRSDAAPQVFQRLGEAGILVRRFTDQPDWLRFGLPGADGWDRLRGAFNDIAKITNLRPGLTNAQ